MSKIRVLTVFGTRPEAIKMAPLVLELGRRDGIESLCCVTGQHREMLDSALEIFGLRPDFDLKIMRHGQSLSSIVSKVLEGLDGILGETRPELVLVHGDTSTTFSAALSAFYHKIPVGHVEAGLRTYDRYSPYPEEMNRTLTAPLSQLHFCPTPRNRENLLKENILANVFVTGNTVIDAMKYTVSPDYRFKTENLRGLDFTKERVILLTAHRRENQGEPMRNILTAVKELTAGYPDVRVVYPVHLSPSVQAAVHAELDGAARVMLTEPLPADELHNLMARCHFVLTDSGGLQEEAPALGKPVLVLRRETERPEAVTAGTVKLAGTDRADILRLAGELLDSGEEYGKMSRAVNPYGDGNACRRIADIILWSKGLGAPPEEWTGE